MTQKTIKLTITADTSGLRAGVGEAKRAVDEFGNSATGAGRRADQGFRSAGQGADRLSAQLERVNSLARRVLGFEVIRRGIEAVSQASNAWAGYNMALEAVLGSHAAATRELAFVRRESDRLGLSLQGTASDYVKLTAASRGTALEGQATRDIFTAVAEASRVLHLSSEETHGALNAIQQMMSKGNVQAEELRGQLGERLPGAFNLAAKAMGVTTQQLNQMLDNGQVLAVDLLPKMASELHKLYGAQATQAANMPAAQFERLKTALFDLSRAIGDGGGMRILSAATEVAISGIRAITSYVSGFSVTLELMSEKASEALQSLESIGATDVFGGLIGKAKEFVSDVLNEFQILPQSLATIFTIQVGLYEKAWITIRTAANQLVITLQGYWLTLEEAWSTYTGSMKALFGSAVDAILQRAGGLADRLSGLYGAVGLDKISSKLSEYAEKLKGAATFEQSARSEMEKTNKEIESRRTALDQQSISVEKNAAVQIQAVNDSINASLEDRDAALQRAAAARALGSAVADAGQASNSAAAAATMSASQQKAAARATIAHRDAIESLHDIQDRLAAQAAGPYAQAQKRYQAALADVREQEEKFIKVGKLDAEARKEIAKTSEDARAAYQRETEELHRQLDVRQRALDGLNDELSLAGLSTDQRRVEEQVMRAVNQALEQQTDLYGNYFETRQAAKAAIDGQVGSFRQEILVIDQSTEALRIQRNEIEQFQGTVADAANRGGEDLAKFAASSLFHFGSIGKSFKDLGRSLIQDAENMVAQMIAQFLRLQFIQPLLAGIFGGSYSIQAAAGQAAAGQIFGGGGAFSLLSPSSWLEAGKSLWNGFSGAGSGMGSSLLGSYGAFGGVAYAPSATGSALGLVPDYAAGAPGIGVGATGTGVYTPSALGYGLGIAGGLFSGYSAYRNAGGGAAGLAAGAAYGIGTAGLIGGVGSLIGGGTFAAGLGGGLGATAAASAGMSGLATAIPVVGWVALAAMVLDKISGGGLFGTKYQTKSATQALNIGPDGGDATLDLYQEGKKSLFRGKKRRTKTVDAGADAEQAADDLFNAISDAMTRASKALEIEMPPVIEASLKTVTEYDKKGHAKSTKYLVDAFGKQWEEATAEAAQKRLGAEAILAVVDAASNGAARVIAEQWQGNVDTLAAGVDFLMAAQTSLTRGTETLGATLQDVAGVVTDLAQSGESLIDTYARLTAETKSVKDAFALAGLALQKTGADLVKFADDIAQAAGGVQQAQTLWQRYFQAFGADSASVINQIDTLKSTALDQLAQIGIDGIPTLDAFKEQFKAAMPTLSADQIVQWLRAADALASVTDAQQAYTNAVEQYDQYSRDLAASLSGYHDGGYQAQMAQIDAWRTEQIATANRLAQAAGLARAREEDLANVELKAAQLRAQALRQLETSTRDMIAQLYGGPAGSLDAINSQIAALESAQQGVMSSAEAVSDASASRYEDELAAIQRIRGYIDSLLLNAQLTTLTPEQQLAEAKKQYDAVLSAAQSGDVSALSKLPDAAQAFLERARGFYASGDQYQGIFDSVTQVLTALGARTPTPGATGGAGGGGPISITASPELQALYEQRDRLLADQERETRLAMAQQLAVQLRELADAAGQPVLELAQSMGVKLDKFVSDLGIDLSHLTVSTVDQLATLSATLGVSLTDLASSVGANLGELTDQNSLINDTLEARILGLPGGERSMLEPLFRAVEQATNEADANAAINTLKDATNALPTKYRDLLAPLLGLPPTTKDAIADTAAIAKRTADMLVSGSGGQSIGEVVGYINQRAADDYSRFTAPVARDIHTMAESLAGSGGGARSANIASVTIASDSIPSIKGSSANDDLVAEVRQLRADMTAQMTALRDERKDGDKVLVTAIDGVSDATITSGNTVARAQMRIGDKMRSS